LMTRAKTALEVGPGQVLTSLARQACGRRASVFASLGDRDARGGEFASLLHGIGELWLEGASVGWQALFGGGARHGVPLRASPLDRRRYWIDRPRVSSRASTEAAAGGGTTAAADVGIGTDVLERVIEKQLSTVRELIARQLDAVRNSLDSEISEPLESPREAAEIVSGDGGLAAEPGEKENRVNISDDAPFVPCRPPVVLVAPGPRR